MPTKDPYYYSCMKCGRRFPVEFNFCPNCGTDKVNPASDLGGPPDKKTVTPGSESNNNPKKKKSNRFVIFLAVLFLLFICSKFKNNQGTTSTSSSPSPSYAEVVKNSEWDASVYQVEQYLKENLKDPESLKIAEWSKVQKLQNGTYMVRCKYRAKNSFGGYVLNNQIFFLDNKGKVVLCQDYK